MIYFKNLLKNIGRISKPTRFEGEKTNSQREDSPWISDQYYS